MTKTDIDKVFIEVANNKLVEIDKNGYVLEGTNGPYLCSDTPVRNSAHWCVIYEYLYNLTGDKNYLDALVKLADYICRVQKDSKSGAVKCMNSDKFTDTNGLIGQAWAIEGLTYAYRVTNKKEYLECSKEIFDSQEFDYKECKWYQIDTNNKNCGFDIAFNHQLWFCAIGVELNSIIKDTKIGEKLDLFLNGLDNHFVVYNNGLIKHLGNEKKKMRLINKIKVFIKKLYPTFITKKNPDKLSVYSFEAAYQLFNLYGFSIIKNHCNNLDFFNSKKFKKALKYGMNIKKLNKLFNVNPSEKEQTSKYAYPYNSPAFEYGYVAKTFENIIDLDLTENLLKIQNTLCFSKKNEVSYDLNTLTARAYELVRYLELMPDEQNKE